MGEVARGRGTLAFGGEDLDLVTAKNDAIAWRLADQSARRFIEVYNRPRL
jgi:hypothetical protein